MWRQFTIEAIFLLRCLMDKYREVYKDLHMVFIDLEKAYNRVTTDVMWWVLEKKWVNLKYIRLIKDMYGVVTNMRTSGGITSEFSITIGLHQG